MIEDCFFEPTIEDSPIDAQILLIDQTRFPKNRSCSSDEVTQKEDRLIYRNKRSTMLKQMFAWSKSIWEWIESIGTDARVSNVPPW